MTAPTAKKSLTDGQRFGLGLAVSGMLAVGAYGLVISYWTVRELAEKLRMPLPHIFPVGIEGGMIAVLAIDIVLTWIGRPIGWLRQVARALSVTAISINAYAGMEYGIAAVVMHALAPAILIVGVEALRHHLLVVLQVPEEKEPIPRGRWLLAPFSSAAMGRRMILWQQPKYSDALDTHLDRHEAIAELRRAFGWRWPRHIPAGLAYRLKQGVRLEESVAEVRALLADHYTRTHTEHEHIVQLMDEHTPAALPACEWREPVRVPTSERTSTIVGGDHIDGWLSHGGRALHPIECASRARARARALAEGTRAVDAIRSWERPAVPAGLLTGQPQEREHIASTREHIGPEQRTRPALHVVPAAEHERVSVTERITEHEQDGEHAEGQEHEQLTIPAAREHERASTTPAARARRARGERTRARIVAHTERHPEHDAEQIAAAIGVHASTVRRHLAAMRDGA